MTVPNAVIEVQPLTEILGLGDTHIDTLIIRELMAEQYDKAYRDSKERPNVEVWLCPPALDALAGENDDPIYYHHKGCGHLPWQSVDRFSVPLSMAKRVGFFPCRDCVELTVELWAAQREMDPILVNDVLKSRRTKITKAEAVALLKGIGEPPHPSLLKHSPDDDDLDDDEAEAA